MKREEIGKEGGRLVEIHAEEEENKSNPPILGTHSELENKAAVSDPEKSFGPLGSLSGDFSLLRDQ